MQVLIGVPCGSGQMPIAMVQSLLQLRKPCPAGFLSIERQRTDKARNALVSECLDKDFTHLLFLDDDNPVPPETLELMLQDDKDVVIAPILGRNPDGKGNLTLCAFYKEDCVFQGEKLRLYNNIMGFRDEGPLHKIDAGGTGCMLIKRKVLETLAEKYGKEVFAFTDITVGGQRRTMSEDVEFCERAVDAGFEIWLDDRIRPIHLTHMNAVQWKAT